MWYCNQGSFTVRGVKLTQEIANYITDIIFQVPSWKINYEPCEIYMYNEKGEEESLETVTNPEEKELVFTAMRNHINQEVGEM